MGRRPHAGSALPLRFTALVVAPPSKVRHVPSGSTLRRSEPSGLSSTVHVASVVPAGPRVMVQVRWSAVASRVSTPSGPTTRRAMPEAS